MNGHRIRSIVKAAFVLAAILLPFVIVAVHNSVDDTSRYDYAQIQLGSAPDSATGLSSAQAGYIPFT